MRQVNLFLGFVCFLGACSEETAKVLAQDESDTARLDDAASDWLSIPYPSDHWRRADGRPNLEAYPNPHAAELGIDLIQAVEQNTFGFALQPTLYVELPEPANKAILDQHPDAALETTSPVQLLALDGPTKRYSLRLEHRSDPGWLEPNHLVIHPPIGEPLQPRSRYALVLLNTLSLSSGRFLGRKASVQQALLASKGTQSDHLAPLRERLSAYDLNAESIALATVFTTDDPEAELKALLRQLDLSAPPNLNEAWDYAARYDSFRLHNSRYDGLLFMHGDKPYAQEGGALLWQDGLAVPYRQDEPMRLAFAQPEGQMPEAGWPVVIYLHGTGGDVDSFLSAGDQSPAGLLAQRGMASLAIEQPIHGLRGTPDTNTDLHTFNAFNATSSRNILRQGALDVMNLVRMIQEGHLDSANWRLNPDAIIFLGHSQGALVGGLLASQTDAMRCWIFSGSGGGLTYTLLDRKEPLDIAEMGATLATSGPLFEGHPVTSLLQHAFEVTDPISAAPRWLDRPASYLMTIGFQDQQTPKRAGHALTMAAEFPLLTPVAETPWRHRREDWPVFGPGVVKETTRRGSEMKTAGVSQYPEQDHFTIFSHARAKIGYLHFAESCASGSPELKARD